MQLEARCGDADVRAERKFQNRFARCGPLRAQQALALVKVCESTCRWVTLQGFWGACKEVPSGLGRNLLSANAAVCRHFSALLIVGAGDTTPNSMAPYAGNNTGTVSRGNGVLWLLTVSTFCTFAVISHQVLHLPRFVVGSPVCAVHACLSSNKVACSSYNA